VGIVWDELEGNLLYMRQRWEENIGINDRKSLL
jgi:hypothetical protein